MLNRAVAATTVGAACRLEARAPWRICRRRSGEKRIDAASRGQRSRGNAEIITTKSAMISTRHTSCIQGWWSGLLSFIILLILLNARPELNVRETRDVCTVRICHSNECNLCYHTSKGTGLHTACCCSEARVQNMIPGTYQIFTGGHTVVVRTKRGGYTVFGVHCEF